MTGSGASSASVVRACPACGTKNRVPVATTGTPRCAACHRPLPWLVDATDADFGPITDTKLPVLVDLWAPWCGPCRMVAPGVEQAAVELAGSLKVVKVNVDEAPGLAGRFEAQSIPMLLVLRSGEVVARQIGALPQERLLEWVRQQVDAGS